MKNLYLSLDPYMRGRMNAGPSYAANVAIGQVMVGGTAGEVVESGQSQLQTRRFGFVGYFGWQQYGVSSGAELQKVDPNMVPLSAYLGAVGMPGLTAWWGLIDIGAPKQGETVVVSAAAGAVGSVVGQIAKLKGCRAVGIAGGKEKCDLVVKEFGFDACVDYKGGNLAKDLRAAAPKGIDIYFENVGGVVLETVALQLNPFARIPLCGLISQYNEPRPHGLDNLVMLLINRVKLQGFITSDYASQQRSADEGTRAMGSRRQDQVSRDDRQWNRECAARVHRAAEGREHRQAVGEVVLGRITLDSPPVEMCYPAVPAPTRAP